MGNIEDIANNSNNLYLNWKDVEICYNLFEGIDILNKSISETTGAVSDLGNQATHTKALKVEQNKNYYLTFEIEPNNYGITNISLMDIIVAYYDENENFITRPRSNYTKPFIINTNNINNSEVHYIRVSFAYGTTSGYGQYLPLVIKNIVLSNINDFNYSHSVISKNAIEENKDIDALEDRTDYLEGLIFPIKHKNNILTHIDNSYKTKNNIKIKKIAANKFIIYGTASSMCTYLPIESNFMTGSHSDIIIKSKNATFPENDWYNLEYTGVMSESSDNQLPYATLIEVDGQNIYSNIGFTHNKPKYCTNRVIFKITFYKNVNYGTEQDPSYIIFNIRNTPYNIELEEEYKEYITDEDIIIDKINALEDTIQNIDLDGDKKQSIISNAISDNNFKYNSTFKKFIDNITNNVNRTSPSNIASELLAGARSVIRRRRYKNNNLIRFSFITDCHLGGNRSLDHNPLHNISAFIDLSNSDVNFAVNGGDLITNYYDATYMNSLDKALETQGQLHDLFSSLTIPYYITKGNHDIGIHWFRETETPQSYSSGYYGIDPDTGAFYSITQSNFNTYLASGLSFYTLDSYQYFDNQTIQDITLNNYCQNAVFNESDPYGWYYCWDFDGVRFIVLNEYYNSGSSVDYGSNQLAWFTNILADAVNNNLFVLTFSHTAKGITNTNYLNAINTFKTNGGVYIGHIHGHEHCDVYNKSNSLNNIGVSASLVKIAQVCTYSGFAFSVFEIDKENKLLYETRIGNYYDMGSDAHGGINYYRSEDRIFDFGSANLLI